MARSTRNQPFCWQEKKILRLFRKHFTKTELIKFRVLYGTITEIDSDFNGEDIKFYTKTIHTYSGLSKDWIPKGLKKLEEMSILKVIEDRVNGKFKGKRVVFTPELVQEIPIKPANVKTINGESFNGDSDTSEDITLLEDISLKEKPTQCVSNYKDLYQKLIEITRLNLFQIQNVLQPIKLKDIDIDLLIEKIDKSKWLKEQTGMNGFRKYFSTKQQLIKISTGYYDDDENKIKKDTKQKSMFMDNLKNMGL